VSELSPKAQLAAFLSKYSPGVQKTAKAALAVRSVSKKTNVREHLAVLESSV